MAETVIVIYSDIENEKGSMHVIGELDTKTLLNLIHFLTKKVHQLRQEETQS